ncbi:MAG: TRAP transporter large permease [Alphaproteobacteria bacterium]|nr:TRAP transporter large permease [Alphaproteobacteria bacterium]MCB9930897.1 TRAP transporter large permease [Alphaproteobacteria bacterium]
MALWAIVIMMVLVIGAVPVAAVLGVLSLSLDYLYMDGRLSLAIGEFTWDKSKEFILVAVPMFILLGEIMLRAGIAQKMYAAVVQWLSWLPGGLMHANIGSCTIFAASSGSSVATAATVGTVAYPEIEKRGYNERLFLGSLAAGGTLGILVPPSINLIIYGLITDTSVPELYLAGIIPGVLLALLFMGVIIFACLARRDWNGDRIETSWSQRLRTLPDLVPPILLFAVVVGSIYAGIATPTEAASVGVVFACVLAAWTRTLNLTMLKEAFEGTMRTTAMIMLIILAAVFLNFILGFIGVTQVIIQAIADLGLTPLETMLIIIAFYLVLGMFMETLSMMLTTVPIVFPIVAHLGYDPVWFGILITVLMETALITPPIGVNLYVVHGIRSSGKFNDVAIGAAPFVAAMLGMIVLLLVFPELAVWLPGQFY